MSSKLAPIDLSDDIAVRRFLQDQKVVTGNSSGDAGSSYEGSFTPQYTLPNASIQKYIQAEVKAFDDAMQRVIDEVEFNLAGTNYRTVLLESNLANNYATITEIAGTYATNDVVGAIYGIEVNASGHISGYKSVATGETSIFKIYADKFAVSSTATNEAYSPFQIDTVNHKINMTANVAIDGNLLTSGSVSAAVLSATAIYGKTINITDSSAPGGILPNGTSSLGYFDTSRDKNALGAVNRTSGGYAISGISTNTGSSVGVHGSGNWGVLGEAIGGGFGFYTTSSCYFEGANYPFTGSHLGFITNNTKLEIGDIVIVVDAYNIEVNNSVFNVLPSSLHNDKKVIGVFNGFTGDIETFAKNSKSLANNETFYPLIDSIKDSHKIVGLNALGEGGVNVCNEGGNIEIGDYICSSSTKGKGMKQDDDLLHNYTVAKALESVDWTTEQSTTKMIACTYHCG